MSKAKDGKRDRKAEVRRLAHLVQKTIDEGADSVEEIHRSIARMPLDVLERLDLFKEMVEDVRKVQDTSIGAIYGLIHKVNDEAAKLAEQMLRERAPRKAAAGKASLRKVPAGKASRAPAPRAHAG
jgi:hypothetical protein